MPFPKQTPKNFTKAKVEVLRTGQMGCYGLYRGDVWVYVGKGDIRDRLLAHLNGDNPCILRENPGQWVDVVTDDYDARERALILELYPECNKRVG